MISRNNKKITRRDAMKVAAAAIGAAALANLPSKWSKPELAAGVLPAHAQTSVPVLHTVMTPFDPEFFPPGTEGPCWDGQGVRFFAVIDPATEGIELQYVLSYNGSPGGSITLPASLTGTMFTNASGEVTLDVIVMPDSPFAGTVGTLSIEWSFVDSTNGTNTISQNADIEIQC